MNDHAIQQREQDQNEQQKNHEGTNGKEKVVEIVEEVVDDAEEEEKIVERDITVKKELIVQEEEMEDEIQAEEEEAYEKMTEEERRGLAEKLIRQTPEYAAALDLEVWKLEERKRFKQHLQHVLKQQEEEAKKNLTSEQRKLEQLENKLRNDIKICEEKKLKLENIEIELIRRREELEFDFKRKAEDMNHQVQMNKEQCAHKISLYELEIEALKNKEMHWKEQIHDLNHKLDEITKQKKNYKFHWKNQQDICSDLRQQISILHEELKKRVDENTKLRQKLLEKKKKKQKHPPSPSTSPLSSPQKNSNQNSPDTAEKIDNHPKRISSPPSPSIVPNFQRPTLQVLSSSVELNREIKRLLGQKNRLLETGNYDQSSEVIIDIDQRIRQLSTAS